MNLFVVRFYAVSQCGECPHFTYGHPDARDDRDGCDRVGVAFEEWQAGQPPPEWCPFRAGASGTDFTDVPHDVLADLQVAIDQHINGRPSEAGSDDTTSRCGASHGVA